MNGKTDLWSAYMVALDEQDDPALSPRKRAAARRRCRTLWGKIKRWRRARGRQFA